MQDCCRSAKRREKYSVCNEPEKAALVADLTRKERNKPQQRKEERRSSSTSTIDPIHDC